MANIKAKIKNIAKIERKTKRNRAIKSQVKTALKKAQKAIIEKDAKKSELIAKAHKVVDMAITKGVLHKNNGARKLSKLDLFANKQNVELKDSKPTL